MYSTGLKDTLPNRSPENLPPSGVPSPACQSHYEDFSMVPDGIENLGRHCPCCLSFGINCPRGAHPRRPIIAPTGMPVEDMDRLADTVAKRLVEKTVVNKCGSALSVAEYSTFPVRIVQDDAEYWVRYRDHANFDAVLKLLVAHTEEVVKLMHPGQIDDAVVKSVESTGEVEDEDANVDVAKVNELDQLQPLSRTFLLALVVAINNAQQLLTVVGGEKKVDKKKKKNEDPQALSSPLHYEMELILPGQPEYISGEMDKALFAGDTRIAIWEDKTCSVPLDKPKVLAQATVELAATAIWYKKIFAKEPLEMCAMLSNGTNWMIMSRGYVDSDNMVKWRRSHSVDAREMDGCNNAAAMLLHYIETAKALAEDAVEEDRQYVSRSIRPPADDEDRDNNKGGDNDDGDGEGGGGGGGRDDNKRKNGDSDGQVPRASSSKVARKNESSSSSGANAYGSSRSWQGHRHVHDFTIENLIRHNQGPPGLQGVLSALQPRKCVF